MPDEDDPKRYYYYASERGCLKDMDSIDEIGVGVHDGMKSCSIRICLMRLRDDGFGRPHYTMKMSAHNDEWRAFMECRDVLDLLSKKTIGPGEMKSDEPFMALRSCLEELGYKNLGKLRD
jgi:hypothetical protein